MSTTRKVIMDLKKEKAEFTAPSSERKIRKAPSTPKELVVQGHFHPNKLNELRQNHPDFTPAELRKSSELSGIFKRAESVSDVEADAEDTKSANASPVFKKP